MQHGEFVEFKIAGRQWGRGCGGWAKRLSPYSVQAGVSTNLERDRRPNDSSNIAASADLRCSNGASGLRYDDESSKIRKRNIYTSIVRTMKFIMYVG